MLFNSYAFVLVFLPITLAGFALILRYRNFRVVASWLVVCSLIFYGWWNPDYVALICASMVFNFAIAYLLLYRRMSRPASTAVLTAGVVANLVLLGFYKYAVFFATAVNDVFATSFDIGPILLPLAISFFTFQQIAFLVDAASGHIKQVTFIEYVIFIIFFPQLIAGPIVHHREMVPQFQAWTERYSMRDVELGLALFTIGLAKKVLIADTLAVYAEPGFTDAAAGHAPTLFDAWLAAIGFTLQIYFDFSGYSDMALGLSNLFGIKLPVNFNSPLKATNIIEFWNRWHVTLTRFLTAYVYNPVALRITRRRIRAGQPLVRGTSGTPSAFVWIVALPTMLTMTLSGLWHGAGYQFIIWGVLHGVYLTVNHGWRMLRSVLPIPPANARAAAACGFTLTFVGVVCAMVFFHAADVSSALRILAGMFGMNGAALPYGVWHKLVTLGIPLEAVSIGFDASGGKAFIYGVLWIGSALLLALTAPNSLEMTGQFQPAVNFTAEQERKDAHAVLKNVVSLSWVPNRAWGVAIGVLLAASLLSLNKVTVFLYWQF
jgi:D-alanyl-lipoteichoic acid acyltransferase DltB (MBOAT superfamily)